MYFVRLLNNDCTVSFICLNDLCFFLFQTAIIFVNILLVVIAVGCTNVAAQGTVDEHEDESLSLSNMHSQIIKLEYRMMLEIEQLRSMNATLLDTRRVGKCMLKSSVAYYETVLLLHKTQILARSVILLHFDETSTDSGSVGQWQPWRLLSSSFAIGL